MRHLLLGLALTCSMSANAAQNIFQITPDPTNPHSSQCRFHDYQQSAKLISTYLQSLLSAKYLSQCNPDFLKDVEDGERKQTLMLPAVESQVDSCYSSDDITFIKSTVKKVLDDMPQFCDSKNVNDAMTSWVATLNSEK